MSDMVKILMDVVGACGLAIEFMPKDEMVAEEKPEQLGQHFSTRADRESLRHGLKILGRKCPNEVIIAEEQENVTAIPADCTVFDPLDGTTNFFNGTRDNGISICTFRDHKPICAATYFRSSGTFVTSVRGEGCYAGTLGYLERIHTIPWHGMHDKTQIGTDVGSWTVRHNTFDTVLKPLAQKFNIVSRMSAVVGARLVLDGNIGAYYNFGIAKIWDAAGMALAVEEAGGIVCDPWGKPLKWDNIECDWIVAANQQLADVVLEHSSKWSGRK